MTNDYDFIIIGAGGTGLAAAMYGARLGLKTLVLGHSYNSGLPVGGTITMTNVVENYPGFIKTSGLLLSKQLKDHAQSYEEVSIKTEEVTKVDLMNTNPHSDLHKDVVSVAPKGVPSEIEIQGKKQGKEFLVKTNKEEYFGRSILFATGTKVKKLNVPGSKELENRGVNYCALCDGPLFKDKIVSVIGGSDSAGKDALILAEHAKKVYIIYRGEEVRAEKATLQKIKSKENIEIINNTNVVEIKGEQKVERVVLDKEFKGDKELELEGIFVAIGHVYLSTLAKELGVKTNDKEEIIINHKDCSTNVKGIFAAGDVTDKQFKQLITGVADGCTAAHSAYEFLV